MVHHGVNEQRGKWAKTKTTCSMIQTWCKATTQHCYKGVLILAPCFSKTAKYPIQAVT